MKGDVLLQVSREIFLDFYEPSSETERIEIENRMNEFRRFRFEQKKAKLNNPFGSSYFKWKDPNSSGVKKDV
jgi:hypothetical protein